MKKDGQSDKCIAEKFEKCPYNSFHCVGEDHANQVYKLVDSMFLHHFLSSLFYYTYPVPYFTLLFFTIIHISL